MNSKKTQLTTQNPIFRAAQVLARHRDVALVPTASHRPTEVADRASASAAAVSLALEDREADQAKSVDTQSIDPAVAALACHVDAIEVGLPQEALGEPLETSGLHAKQLLEQLLLPARFLGGSPASG